MIVRDHGFGIPKKDRENVFDPYKRLESNTEITGLGLGLHIVKQLVEAHCGHVQVEGEPGQETVFKVELPEHYQSPIPTVDKQPSK